MNGTIVRPAMPKARPPRECRRCGVLDRNHGRGLCWRCHSWAQRTGRLCDFERQTRTADELLAEWDVLRREGYAIRDAARRLGLTTKGLERAIDRAAKRGDERARRRAAA